MQAEKIREIEMTKSGAILVVDDNPQNVKLLADLSSGGGPDVRESNA